MPIFVKGQHSSPKTEFKKGIRGDESGHWKGGKVIHNGYVMKYCPNHPSVTMRFYAREHRLVMEEIIGRYLLPGEKIHHKNGIKTDNRKENLELFSNHSTHMKTRKHKRRGRQK